MPVKKATLRGPRLTAINAISDVLDQGRNLTESPALQAGSKQGPQGRDLALARHLAYGVLRWLTALEWLAGQLMSKPFKSRDQDIYRLVLLGLHQLWRDQTPAHAAINETAECARQLGKPWAVGVINALLRRFQREHIDWLERLAEVPEHLAHPGWLREKIVTDWPNDWQGILDANNVQPPLWLRLNRLGPERNTVVERLENEGYEVHSHPNARDAIQISPAAQVADLPGFSAGHLSVQDPAAQLAADLLDVQPGMRVLDACAAPGGKTCHLLERTPGADITAIDLYENRVELIRQNLQRLQLKCTLLTADATIPASWWDGTPFERILIDAPCSASGVIRRHPEIKHLRQPGQVAEAVVLQRQLLEALWPLLEPGGMLVYATCSLFKDENSGQINAFMQNCGDAELVGMPFPWGKTQEPGRQILPGEEGMDGFYYAVIRKTA